jgi:Plant transposon protein
MMCYEAAADKLVEIVGMSESLIMECLPLRCDAIVESLGGRYLRAPTAEELAEIESRFAEIGFPGCVGSVDCSSWEWVACPVAWSEMFKGKDKKKCVRLEVICDDFLYIWHMNFGSPGARNDLVQHSSDHSNRIRMGLWPPTRPETMIGNLLLRWYYYLADGIYPRWRVFITSITNPRTAKEKTLSKQQEVVRKGVERVFGVMSQQFQVLYRPCHLWYLKSMRSVMMACVVIHNMVVLQRKHRYTGTRVAESGKCELPSGVVRTNTTPQTESEHVQVRRTVAVPVESRVDHHRLKDALTNYIWKIRYDKAENRLISDADDFSGIEVE